MTYKSKNEKETLDIANKFAKFLKPGAVIALNGDLGAGKTVFSKGIAKGLGIKQVVNSPTFVIMKTYPFKQKNKSLTLAHIDAYRLESERDLEAIGVRDYLGKKDAIVIIEWARKVKDILPKETIYISIKSLSEEKREIEVLQA